MAMSKWFGRVGRLAERDRDGGDGQHPPACTAAPRFDDLRERWRDRGLTALLAIQMIVIFIIVPVTAQTDTFPHGAVALLLLAFMSLTVVLAQGSWTLAWGLGTFALNAAVALVQHVHDGVATDAALNVATLLSCGALSVVVAAAVFRPGEFTADRIRGSVVLYLNLGLSFAFVHRIVAELLPGAYTNVPGVDHRAAFRAAFDYFSFTSLTSVGSGDIVPVQPIARSVTMLETTLGQLVPVLLIGRVVSYAIKDADRAPDAATRQRGER